MTTDPAPDGPRPEPGVAAESADAVQAEVAPAAPELRTHPGPPNALARNVVIGVLVAFVVASNLANAFLSVLVTERPLLFIALNAQNRNLALASGELSAVSFYLVGFLRLLGPDPFFFLLGRWYGDGAIRWLERRAPTYGELVRQLETWFMKARYAVIAFAPNNYVCLFAGASGMAWGGFLLANVIGTIIRLVLIRTFSNLFEGPLGSLRTFIGEYRWPLLALTILLVAVSILSERRSGRGPVTGLAGIDEDIAEHERPRSDMPGEA